VLWCDLVTKNLPVPLLKMHQYREYDLNYIKQPEVCRLWTTFWWTSLAFAWKSWNHWQTNLDLYTVLTKPKTHATVLFHIFSPSTPFVSHTFWHSQKSAHANKLLLIMSFFWKALAFGVWAVGSSQKLRKLLPATSQLTPCRPIIRELTLNF
jgi:hypothetical protein